MRTQYDEVRKRRDIWYDDYTNANNKLIAEEGKTKQLEEKVKTLEDVISTQTKVISCLDAKLKKEHK